MKRITFLISFLSLVGFIYAQTWNPPQPPKFESYHDIRIGIGYKPFEGSKFTFGDAWYPYHETVIDFDTKDYYNGARYTTNAFFWEYIYQANKWFGVGATLTYFAYFNNYYDAETNTNIGANLTHHLSLYPTLRLTWINNPGFGMYSAFGIGTRYVFENDRLRSTDKSVFSNGIACQVTLLGFTIGKNMYVFTDFCTIGTQGMLTGGIGYRIVSHHK
jgi:hypothetical protein